MVTRGYRRLQGVTKAYKRLQGVTRRYKLLQEVTRDKTVYWRLLGVTGGLKGV